MGGTVSQTVAVEDDSWVVVRAGTHLCAIPALSVQTMVRLPQVVKVPQASSYVRGVVNLRGHVLPVVDLRSRCGLEPLSKHIEDLCKTLEQREQDHRNWLAELEQSVAERRKFTLTTDPHKCAFGKWYDHYRSDDLVLTMLLKRFDEPHKAIHAIGQQVEQLKEAGDFDAAAATIKTTRDGTLSQLIALFALARDQVRHSAREIAVVIEGRQKPFALAVDNVESTEHLDAAAISEVASILNQRCGAMIRGVAKRKKDQQMVLLLEIETLLAEAQNASTQAA